MLDGLSECGLEKPAAPDAGYGKSVHIDGVLLAGAVRLGKSRCREIVDDGTHILVETLETGNDRLHVIPQSVGQYRQGIVYRAVKCHLADSLETGSTLDFMIDMGELQEPVELYLDEPAAASVAIKIVANVYHHALAGRAVTVTLEGKSLVDIGGKDLGYGNAVFWYMNQDGRILYDKRIAYKEDGHRNKDFFPGRQYRVADGYSGRAYFGAHLKADGKKAFIMESEKSVLLCALYYGNRRFMATGGKGNLREVEEGMMLVPDMDARMEWEEKGEVWPWWRKWGLPESETGDHADIGDMIVDKIQKER